MRMQAHTTQKHTHKYTHAYMHGCMHAYILGPAGTKKTKLLLTCYDTLPHSFCLHVTQCCS